MRSRFTSALSQLQRFHGEGRTNPRMLSPNFSERRTMPPGETEGLSAVDVVAVHISALAAQKGSRRGPSRSQNAFPERNEMLPGAVESLSVVDSVAVQTIPVNAANMKTSTASTASNAVDKPHPPPPSPQPQPTPSGAPESSSLQGLCGESFQKQLPQVQRRRADALRELSVAPSPRHIHSTEMYCGTEKGSYLRLTDS